MLFCELMKNHYYNDARNKKNRRDKREMNISITGCMS